MVLAFLPKNYIYFKVLLPAEAGHGKEGDEGRHPQHNWHVGLREPSLHQIYHKSALNLLRKTTITTRNYNINKANAHTHYF